MHSAPIFKVDDLVWIQKLVTDHPLGWISAWVHGQVDSHPVPLIWTERGLVGHLLASHDWAGLSLGQVSVSFTGVSGYISPNAYPSKQQDPRVVPTYNYQAAVVRGKLMWLHSDEQKLSVLNALTDHFEQVEPHPWSINDAPQDYIERMLAGIVAFCIEPSEIQGKSKMSQNQSQQNRAGVKAWAPDQLSDLIDR